MALDIRTVFVIVALLYLILPTFVWIVLLPQRKLAVNLWCGGGLLLGAGFLLVGLRGSIPELATYEGANLALFAGTLSFIQALRLDLGSQWRWKHLGWITLAYLLVYIAIRHGTQDNVLRQQRLYILYVVWLGLILHLALLASRIAIVEKSNSARWMAVTFFSLAAALALRQWSVFSGANNTTELDSGGAMEILSIVAVLTSIVGQIGYVGLMLDRSARRSIEAAATRASEELSRRLGAQIAQLDRQRVLGTMSASLGHELTQPLSAILLSAGSAQRGVLSGAVDAVKLTEFLDSIVDSTRRASKIIERIRSFIRPSEMKLEAVDLELIVHGVTALIADEARSGQITISCQLPTPGVQVAGDPTQLSQVILNLFRNAIEAMSSVSQRELHVTLVRQEGRAVLKIRDTGPGLSPQALVRAGTPFFTTKAGGLGLGLSISRTIVKQFDGTFSIKNADEGGTVVELAWPALGTHTQEAS
jgi:C4-dicarboxylate-specific signal transduction histidine kinase